MVASASNKPVFFQPPAGRVLFQLFQPFSDCSFSRLLAEYSDLLGLVTEQDVVILGRELESGDPGDLIRRVEDLLGKTKAKDGAPKSVRLKDSSGKWLVKETFRSAESEKLLLRRTQNQEKAEHSDLRVEVSEPGRRKIINMSDTGSSDSGRLDAQDALTEVMTEDRGRERRSRDSGFRRSPQRHNARSEFIALRFVNMATGRL